MSDDADPAADAAAIASGASMPVRASDLAKALARGLDPENARHYAQCTANARRPRIAVRGVGSRSFAPVGDAETPRSPVRRPVRADAYSADDLRQAYYAACEIADARDAATGTKPAKKRLGAAYKWTREAVAAALNNVMHAYAIDELPRAPVPNRASVPRIAVGTLMCRPNENNEDGYKFGRVCKVDADGTLHVELYATEQLGSWHLHYMNTLYHCRVVDAEPRENASAKRARHSLRDPATDLGAAWSARARCNSERLRPEFSDGRWKFRDGRGSWAPWGGAPGDEYHETLWHGH